MGNKLCTVSGLAVFFLFCANLSAVALAKADADILQNFDIRKNYSGNPRATVFSDSVDNSANTTGVSAVAPEKADKQNFENSLPAARTFADDSGEESLEKKKEALRKKTLANYADTVAARPAFVETSAGKSVKADEKVSSKEILPGETEIQVKKTVESKSKAVSSLPVTVSSLSSSSKKGEVKIIRTDMKNVVSEPDVSQRAVPDGGGKETAGKSSQVAPVTPTDPACANAELEAERARAATTQADKLFYLRRASRLCPSFAGYHIEIGQVYAALGRKDDARFSYNKALEIEPDNGEAKKLISGLK